MNTLPNELTSIIYEYSKKKVKSLTDEQRFDIVELIVREAFAEYFEENYDKTKLIELNERNATADEWVAFCEEEEDTLDQFAEDFIYENFNNDSPPYDVKYFHKNQDLSWFLFFIKVIKFHEEDAGGDFTEYNDYDKVVDVAFYYIARCSDFKYQFDLETQSYLSPHKTDLTYCESWFKL